MFTRYIVFMFLIIGFSSCKKSTEEPFEPILNWSSPALSSIFLPENDVLISISADGNGQIIRQLSVAITDSLGNFVGEALHFPMLQTAYQLSTSISLPTDIKKRGIYFVRVSIKTDFTEYRFFRTIFIELHPLQLTGVLAVYADGTIEKSTIDGTKLLFLNEGISKSDGFLLDNKIFIATANGKMQVIDSRKLIVEKEVQLSTGGIQTPIRALAVNQSNLVVYVGTADGRVIGYNQDLQVVYNQTQSIRANYNVINIFPTPNFLVLQWTDQADIMQNRLITFSNYASAGFVGEVSAPFDIWALTTTSYWPTQYFLAIQNLNSNMAQTALLNPESQTISPMLQIPGILKGAVNWGTDSLLLLANNTVFLANSKLNVLQLRESNTTRKFLRKKINNYYLDFNANQVAVHDANNSLIGNFTLSQQKMPINIFAVWE